MQRLFLSRNIEAQRPWVACRAWVWEAAAAATARPPPGLCFLKTANFCVNNASDPCGGCEHNGRCPCSAGVKAGVHQAKCGGGGGGKRAGRACGRMGFASASLLGPYLPSRGLGI
jgi:hypothetical protein